MSCLRGSTPATFVRIGFNYFISEAVFDYILEAVHLLANEGWKLLPLYRFDPATGLWSHADRPSRPRTSLQDVSFTAVGPIGRAVAASAQPESALWRNLEEASRIIRATEATPPGEIDEVGPMSAEFERIRWFPLPGEVLDDLRADARLRLGPGPAQRREREPI